MSRATPTRPPRTLLDGAPLTSREDTDIAARLARSARERAGRAPGPRDITGWLAERAEATVFGVERIPFSALDGWSFDPDTGDLGHRSGRFFTVQGMHVTHQDGPFPEWRQPIISQPEVGILGIVVKEFGGVLHFLMQAKMEPGNRTLLQLSPTVQATRSNYTKVHRGADVKYIDHFVRPGHGRVLADVLQSEHGSWFLRKSNRNMIVEAVDDVPLLDDFCWLTLGQINDLLHESNTVNMDARTVLSCLPHTGDPRALHSDVELLSWFTAERSRHDVHTRRIPLAETSGWHRGTYSIDHEEGRYFRVVAVDVRAGNREVTRWSQPLFEPVATGVTAFLVREAGGVRHVLAHARVEGGFLDTVELGPTVQYTPDNHAHLTGADRPPFLDAVLAAAPERIRYEAVHSEEGGRFLNAESRYLLVDADEATLAADPPPGFRWVSEGQLTSLVRHGHYVNVQARTLLACLHATREPR
ncbi:NDP-hexose 2,3-dehydratase family protein [Streptomyces sp. NPDC056056]|uniref:NDP-hexose 2,3-dehydratase family protein n=1 Tax=Streptomyces sp. NPDC056056 TaxID=3345698 RepID=UPI0035DC9F7A